MGINALDNHYIKVGYPQKILDLFECLFIKSNAENDETTKKMGYFLNKCYLFI